MSDLYINYRDRKTRTKLLMYLYFGISFGGRNLGKHRLDCV